MQVLRFKETPMQMMIHPVTVDMILGKIPSTRLFAYLDTYTWSVGNGSFAKVYRSGLNTNYALKIYNARDVDTFIRERIYSGMFCRFLDSEGNTPGNVTCRYIDEHYISGEYYIDQVPAESYIKCIPQEHLPFITYMILLQLKQYHDNGYVHTDVKPFNILFYQQPPESTYPFVPILADMGSIEYLQEKTDSLTRGVTRQTKYIRSPEQTFTRSLLASIKGPPVNGKIDIWSLGISLLEMAGMLEWSDVEYHHYGIGYDTEENLLSEDSGMSNAYKLYKKRNPQKLVSFEAYIKWKASPVFTDLIKSMLKVDPVKRASVDELLCNPYFKGVKNIAPTTWPLAQTLHSIFDDDIICRVTPRIYKRLITFLSIYELRLRRTISMFLYVLYVMMYLTEYGVLEIVDSRGTNFSMANVIMSINILHSDWYGRNSELVCSFVSMMRRVKICFPAHEMNKLGEIINPSYNFKSIIDQYLDTENQPKETLRCFILRKFVN